MSIISHRELRNDSAEVLRRIAAGEDLTVTNHGEPVARLVPVGRSPLEEARAAGRTRPARAPRDFTWIHPVAGESSEDILRDLRGDR